MLSVKGALKGAQARNSHSNTVLKLLKFANVHITSVYKYSDSPL